MQKDSLDYESNKITIINAVCGLAHSLTPMPVQPPKYTFKMCAQFASLFVELLKDVGDGMIKDYILCKMMSSKTVFLLLLILL